MWLDPISKFHHMMKQIRNHSCRLFRKLQFKLDRFPLLPKNRSIVSRNLATVDLSELPMNRGHDFNGKLSVFRSFFQAITIIAVMISTRSKNPLTHAVVRGKKAYPGKRNVSSRLFDYSTAFRIEMWQIRSMQRRPLFHNAWRVLRRIGFGTDFCPVSVVDRCR